MLVVVVGGGWAPGMIPPVTIVVAVAAVTCRGAAVMVMVRMIRMMSQFFGLILDPGRT